MEPTNLWKTALENLQIELSPAEFKTWFSKTNIQSQKKDHYKIACPNSYTKKRLKSKYKDQIKQILDKLTRSKTSIDFVINAAAPPNKDTNIGPLFQAKKKTPGKKKTKLKKCGLSHRYTFDNFVVGNNNNLAYAVAKSISENPGTRYNPFFLYSEVGMGKTHLIQAIGNKCLQENPNLEILYCTSEDFANQLIQAIQNHNTSKFKNKFRTVDVLIIDDIQFIAGRDTTQEEFFHTFNKLYMEQKQIVLTSDKPPKEIPNLEERLSSRFESGMLADIQKPDFDIRLAILQKKCELSNINIPNEVLAVIAKTASSNIRELEGALNRVVTMAQTQQKKPNAALAKRVLGTPQETKPPSADDIIKKVCDFYTLHPKDLKGKRRPVRIARPRQIAMYLMRKTTNLPYAEIGNQLGGRDHTTVMHGVEKVERLIHNDSGIKSQVMEIKSKLRG